MFIYKKSIFLTKNSSCDFFFFFVRKIQRRIFSVYLFFFYETCRFLFFFLKKRQKKNRWAKKKNNLIFNNEEFSTKISFFFLTRIKRIYNMHIYTHIYYVSHLLPLTVQKIRMFFSYDIKFFQQAQIITSREII